MDFAFQREISATAFSKPKRNLPPRRETHLFPDKGILRDEGLEGVAPVEAVEIRTSLTLFSCGTPPPPQGVSPAGGLKQLQQNSRGHRQRTRFSVHKRVPLLQTGSVAVP